MNYAEIKTHDIANGDGVRISLFVSGCRMHCPGCFNKEAQDFGYGKEFTTETIEYIIKCLEPDYIQGLSILGGEPFEPENQRAVLTLIEEVRRRLPKKDIWIWTGRRLQELDGMTGETPYRTEFTDYILSQVDYVIDGQFIADLYDPTLKYRGSLNQNVWKMTK